MRAHRLAGRKRHLFIDLKNIHFLRFLVNQGEVFCSSSTPKGYCSNLGILSIVQTSLSGSLNCRHKMGVKWEGRDQQPTALSVFLTYQLFLKQSDRVMLAV